MLARLLAALLAYLTPLLRSSSVTPLLALLAPAASTLLVVAEAPSAIVAASTATLLAYIDTPLQAASTAAAVAAAAIACIRRGGDPLVDAVKRLRGAARPKAYTFAAAAAAAALLLAMKPSTPLQAAVSLASMASALAASTAAPRRPAPATAAAYILAVAASPLTPAYAFSLLVDAAPMVEEGVEPLAPAEAILAYQPVKPYARRVRHRRLKWWWLRLQPGTTYHHPHRGSVNPHIVVVGSTGSGKSHAAALLSANLARTGATILAVDPHGEYADLYRRLGVDVEVLDASKYGLNPLELLPGETPRTRARQVVELIKAQYPIGPLQSSILENAIIAAYMDKGFDPDERYGGGGEASWPTLNDAARYIAVEASAGRRSAETLNYYISDFLEKVGGEPIDIGRVMNLNTVVDLHRIHSRGAKALYVDTLLRLLHHRYMELGVTEKLRKVVVVDEAHTFYPRSRQNTETTLTRMVRELRKYGVAVVTVTQSPLDLEREVIDNSATLIALTLTEPRVIDYTARLIAAFKAEDRLEAVKLMIHGLPRGKAVLRAHGLPAPIIINLEWEKAVI